MVKKARHGSRTSTRNDVSTKRLLVNVAKNVLRKAANVVSVGSIGTFILWASPAMCIAAAIYAYSTRGYFAIGGEALLVVLLPGLGFFLRSFADAKDNFESGMPVPERRFTEEYEDGQVNVENDRLQEMILYVADVENWLDDHGYEYGRRSSDDV